MLDDEYLNGMARLCGWQATLVYNSLCRHSSKEQECFPSQKLMAEQHGVSRPTILKGLENLEKRNVIKIEKIRSKGGQWLNNKYILLDKSEWKYDHVNEIDMVHHVNENTPPCKRGLHDHVNDVDTKETHKQGNTYKETHTSNHGLHDKISEIIKEFESVNPSCKSYYGNKTQRNACELLIEQYGFDETKGVISILSQTNEMPYFPTITTPYQLHQKWSQLESAVKKNRSEIKNKNKVAFI